MSKVVDSLFLLFTKTFSKNYFITKVVAGRNYTIVKVTAAKETCWLSISLLFGLLKQHWPLVQLENLDRLSFIVEFSS